ncbi:unnamed protein product [Vitrella brassicaformis CCMP3155]|uniref:Uncharacterized protein n=1 Tax=Vitrella brassicaformis (strain CCMP3155) TaxID=1169540 RepID=A0A0G4ECT2_VITBC|nr:unnamed protein product [Vitrella brassicaformis CCMP3155]|eukprot:CEL93355.1 unnamed protein product [Vitrella brassicaformis CCMP3155]
MVMTTASPLNLTLNPLMWKNLTAVPISLQDLNDADSEAVEWLRQMRALDGGEGQWCVCTPSCQSVGV